MKTNTKITTKLTQFIRKFYTNKLLKGSLLFISIGLLYFIFTVLIEYFLWLKPVYRTLLFWLFITVEICLLIQFIIIPLFYLFGFKKGITHEQSAKIIGNHFPEVQDKLTNLLQLQGTSNASELVLASINQKTIELSPVPFKTAVNFKNNFKYLKYVAIPILIFLGFQFSGNQKIITNSYERVLDYKTAYTPPAPFTFIIKNKNFKALVNKNFTIEVTTKGKILPTDLKINFNSESYYLTKVAFNTYEYQFQNLQEKINFNLSANDVVSKDYQIKVVSVPSIINFKMELDYPSYTGKKDEIISNTGNITLPEGTLVHWKLNTKTTDSIQFIVKDSSYYFKKNKDLFSYKQRIFSATNYLIATSNSNIQFYEKLSYNLQVIKDEFPEIQVQSKPDSLDNQIIYFLGKISDDYGLKKLQLVYNQLDINKKIYINIPIKNNNYQQFTYVFPGNLALEKGKEYTYYFEITDNDSNHNFKKSKSNIFTYNKLTKTELEEKILEEQKDNIKNLDKSLQKLNKDQQVLKDIQQLQKEKKTLSWMDKLKVKKIINKQDKQNALMKQFNKDIQRNLENIQKDENQEDLFKEELKERLKDQELEIEKNEKLLEELKQLKDKINDEELFDKIEKLTKDNQSKEKSLEQILELTKRYYLNKKFDKIADELQILAKKQNELANKSDSENNKLAQDKLNNEFKKIQEDIESIKKENQDLKQPMQMDSQKESQESIKKEQEKASINLEKKQQKKAKKQQNSAAKKMEEMSSAMRKNMQSSSSNQLDEDIDMLRQILDNLLTYSFDQESLLIQFKNLEVNFSLPNKLKKQQVLKEHFKHIDDSLFTLSLRQPKISEVINHEITEVHYNINKSLERFSDLKIDLATTNQQYALVAANNLANLLSSMLNAMQNQQKNQQMGMGSCDKPGGKGESFSLPDIIEKQGELLDKMKSGKKPGNKGKSGKDGDGKSGENGKKNQDGGKGKLNGEGSGNNPDENSAEQLYEIYKKQQDLKNQLQEYLKQNNTINTDANQLLKQMELLENNLLENGFDEQVAKQMENLKHNLLKLLKASFQQEKENKRESTTSNRLFKNTKQSNIPNIEQYFNEVEILNRQALPLQPIYKNKVRQYFNSIDD